MKRSPTWMETIRLLIITGYREGVISTLDGDRPSFRGSPTAREFSTFNTIYPGINPRKSKYSSCTIFPEEKYENFSNYFHKLYDCFCLNNINSGFLHFNQMSMKLFTPSQPPWHPGGSCIHIIRIYVVIAADSRVHTLLQCLLYTADNWFCCFPVNFLLIGWVKTA